MRRDGAEGEEARIRAAITRDAGGSASRSFANESRDLGARPQVGYGAAAF